MTDLDQKWTEEIKSDDSLFSINFNEVWRYRDLLLVLVKRDFVTVYKQTILGPIWFFMQPVLTSLIYIFLFGIVAKITPRGIPELAFYLAGITIWNYFFETLTKISNVFKDNASLMGKVYFPRLIMPLSIAVSVLLKFAIQFGLFLIVILYYALMKNVIHPNNWVLATPILLLLMAMFSLGLGMIFSAMTTKYKDLIFLLTFGIQLFMYVTPVVYEVDTIPVEYQWLIKLNPLTAIFECFRFGFLGKGSFEPFSLLMCALSTSLILLFGIIIFNKVQKTFMDTI